MPILLDSGDIASICHRLEGRITRKFKGNEPIVVSISKPHFATLLLCDGLDQRYTAKLHGKRSKEQKFKE